MTTNSKDLFWSDFWIGSQANYGDISGSNRIKVDWHKNGMIRPNLETNHTRKEWDQIFKIFKDTCSFYNPNLFRDIYWARPGTKEEGLWSWITLEQTQKLDKKWWSISILEGNSEHSKVTNHFLDISRTCLNHLQAFSCPEMHVTDPRLASPSLNRILQFTHDYPLLNTTLCLYDHLECFGLRNFVFWCINDELPLLGFMLAF